MERSVRKKEPMQWILRKIGLREKKGERTKVAGAAVEAKWSCIPEDIVHEILLRLPAKSLGRFKAVCKQYWRASISDPQFAKLHAYQANKRYNNNNYIHLSRDVARFHYHSNVNQSREAGPHSVLVTPINSGDLVTKSVELDYPFEYPPKNSVVLGSCNGLLLIIAGSSDKTFLWNPSTGERKMFPSLINIKLILYNYQRVGDYISGLGYDRSLDEYKAVILATGASLNYVGECKRNKHMFIFSSSTGNWKEVEGVHDFNFSKYRSNSLGLMVNGAPHWKVSNANIESYGIIIYFDTVDEKFKSVPTPSPSWWSDVPDFNITVLEGCLCILGNFESNLHVDVWAMKEYGVKNSWTKLFVVQLSCLQLMPLGFINNGDELVLLHGNKSKLVTYNLKTKKGIFLGLSETQSRFNVAASYVESLVSP